MFSPGNLELDSGASRVSEWSLSMATPTNKQTIKESSFLLATSGTTSSSTEPEENECPTTDESMLGLRSLLDRPMKTRRQISSREHIVREGKKVRGSM